MNTCINIGQINRETSVISEEKKKISKTKNFSSKNRLSFYCQVESFTLPI